MKKVLILSFCVLVLTACTAKNSSNAPVPTPKSQVSSYQECIAAGYPVMESYPARCQVPDGPSFTQEIGNEIELADEIIIESPRPTANITSPLEIKGRARGTWFFEGSMTAELLDENDQPITTVPLQATGEWMTTEFVPFTGKLEFELTPQTNATLLIKNANPSGLPENEKVLRVPVVIQ